MSVREELRREEAETAKQLEVPEVPLPRPAPKSKPKHVVDRYVCCLRVVTVETSLYVALIFETAPLCSCR